MSGRLRGHVVLIVSLSVHVEGALVGTAVGMNGGTAVGCAVGVAVGTEVGFRQHAAVLSACRAEQMAAIGVPPLVTCGQLIAVGFASSTSL